MDDARIAGLRDRLAEGLLATVPGAVESAVRGGDRSSVLPGICHLCIDGVDAETLLFLLESEGVVASAASSESVTVRRLAPSVPRKAAAPSMAQTRAASTADALSALMNLGYAQGEAAQAVSTIAAEQPEADTSTLIRAALKLLAPKAR